MSRTEGSTRAITIVGGGCSGTLVAAQLLRAGFRGELTIVEPRARLGAGLAYSTPFDQHLLNVPAAKMSGLPSEPQHFLEWLRTGPMPDAAPESFAPRKLYGDYLESLLEQAAAAGNLRHIRAEATAAVPDGPAVHLTLSDGSIIRADHVVLALGNPASSGAPAAPNCGERWHASPWLGDALRVRSEGERILILGAGLTAVDCALALHSQELTCRTFMLSRRGILPHVHNLRLPPNPPPSFEHRGNLGKMFGELRRHIAAAKDADLCWRVVVDSLRPVTNEVWRELPVADQNRFLRHLKTYWETHRHRMAPQIRERLTAYRESGALELIAGRILETSCDEVGNHSRIQLRPGGERLLEVDRVIVCTGVQENYRNSPRPLVRSLMAQGLAQAHDLGIGLRTDSNGALLDAGMRASTVFFTLGPPRRGELIETTAVPEIRVQAENLARFLTT